MSEKLWFEDTDSKDWTNPVNMLKIKEAVAKRKHKIMLDGRSFSITYEHDRVFVKVVGNYAPCGWFNLETLARYSAEGEY